MKISQYDVVLLKDGTEGCVVEILGNGETFYVDIGHDIETWDNILVKSDEIDKIVLKYID